MVSAVLAGYAASTRWATSRRRSRRAVTKLRRRGGELQRLAIAGYAWDTLAPGQQLLAVIGVGLGAFDVHIATAQPRIEIEEDADLKLPALEHRLHVAPGPDEGLPADAGKVEGESLRAHSRRGRVGSVE